LADEQGYKNRDKVVMFTSFEDKKYEYAGTSDSSAIQNWLYATCLPRVGEFTQENEQRYKKRNLPILKAYFDVDWGSNVKHTNYYVNRMKKALDNDKSVKDKLSFAVVNKKQFGDEMAKFGLEGKDFGVAIDDFANNQKYRMVGEFSVANLEKFTKDFLDHKLESYIKSDPIPESNDGGVKVVVGKNFKDIVLDPTKDVLLEMYAPWCGHCKKLEPAYTELGNKLKDVPGLTIAKMDATANDSPHPKYQARGYPTILYAPANNKDNPISYSGERDVKAFESWLKDKATTAWKKKDEL
jgi:protein disulfide isomerase family A protein 3